MFTEMPWWEVKDRNSAIGTGSKTFRFQKSLPLDEPSQCLCFFSLHSLKGKGHWKFKREGRKWFWPCLSPKQLCQCTRAWSNPQQIGICSRKNSSALALHWQPHQDSQPKAIPIKPLSPLERFLSLKGENKLQFHWQQSCHLCHK